MDYTLKSALMILYTAIFTAHGQININICNDPIGELRLGNDDGSYKWILDGSNCSSEESFLVVRVIEAAYAKFEDICKPNVSITSSSSETDICFHPPGTCFMIMLPNTSRVDISSTRMCSSIIPIWVVEVLTLTVGFSENPENFARFRMNYSYMSRDEIYVESTTIEKITGEVTTSPGASDASHTPNGISSAGKGTSEFNSVKDDNSYFTHFIIFVAISALLVVIAVGLAVSLARSTRCKQTRNDDGRSEPIQRSSEPNEAMYASVQKPGGSQESSGGGMIVNQIYET